MISSLELRTNANESDRRRLLDSAAKILRQQATPESRFHALVEGVPDATPSSMSGLPLPYTERVSHMAEPGQALVGDMPPQPPTLRGRVGAVLVSIVRRMLFWYTEQIRAQHKRIADAAREQVRVLQDLTAAERRGRAALDELSQGVAGQLAGLQDEVARVASRLEAAAGRDEQNADKIETIGAEMRSLLDRVSALEKLAGSSYTSGLDHFFVQHAEAFRGDREEIKRRLAVYLPYAQKAYADTAQLPALDLGCGRGEWLEVLAAAGIPGGGIDSNREFIAGCAALGLDVTEGHLPQALRSIAAESRAVVSAIHVLEHLAFQDLLEVVDQTARILKPGGIAIFETPNPKNLFVSSNNFYLDPTHRQPLPSEFLAFVLQERGLSDLEVIPLQYANSDRLPDNGYPTAVFLNDHFFAAQDYGIIARKAPH
jgi:2-polyprenyl-3-methyl-5-hydroxy-6-metoxy-1,4-benzoquinol methylase